MIYIIGDSHVSVFAGIDVGFDGKRHIQPEFNTCYTIESGALRKKINHFEQKNPHFCAIKIGSNTAYNSYDKLPVIMKAIKEYEISSDDYVFTCFGEIDIRNHIGFHLGDKTISDKIIECVDRYLLTILYLKDNGVNVGVYGSPPSTVWSFKAYGDVMVRNKMTIEFNDYLKSKCDENNIQFKDISKQIILPDGTTDESYIMDELHLSQKAMPLLIEEFKDLFEQKQDINLIGGGFQHSPSTSGFDPIYMKWVKGKQTAPISIYVDHSIKNIPNKETRNYAWLVESKTINQGLYDWAERNTDYLKENYISVFTHDASLVEKSEIFTLTQTSGKSFIGSGDVYAKSKLISMIASNKVMCPEHKYRQKIIQKFSNKVDHFGFGFKSLPNKIDGLKDYYFSIAMENGTYSNMFTEKITDCFMAGTIPIYYGMPNIGEFFDMNGIIILDDNFKVEDLTIELYQSKIDAVRNNFKIANEMLCAEDYIYINYIKKKIKNGIQYNT